MSPEPRPWDWMLDGVAPFTGWLIAVTIFLAARGCFLG